ncbi:unnamed protein product [Rhizophagus irregularis]|nr:unnamed protein product [Rhizophagus irregularis]
MDTSKSKPNRSKNKSKSKKKQSTIDKINSITTSSNSSNKSLIDKKKSSQNKNIPSKESITQTSTSILLGFPDGNISTKEDNDPYITKIGGKPNWLIESYPLSHDFIICKNCDKDMFLLFQGYVPLDDSIYDRVIYIFGCNQQKCVNKSGSFRVFRAHRKDEEYERYQQERANRHQSRDNSNNSSIRSSNVINGGLGNMLFGVADFDNIDEMDDMQISENDIISSKEEQVDEDEDDHDDDEWPELGINNKMSSTTTWQSSWSQVISDAEKARNEKDQIKDQVSSKHDNDDNMSQISVDMSTLTLNTCWPENIKSFPAQYLYITEEVLKEKNDDIPANYLSYEEVEDNFDWIGEKYEKPILPKGYDKTFKKFSDRVAEWPDQCVRYQFDGQPLLYTHNDVTAKLLLDNCNDKITSSKLPVCHWCKSSRVFELQLMPSMLTTLSTSSFIEENEINSDKKNKKNKKNDNSIFNLGMEWGTIMVFTCKNDCEMNDVGFNEVSYYEEVVLVQNEQ